MLCIYCVSYIEDDKKLFTNEVHRLSSLGVYFLNLDNRGLMVQNDSESSLVAEVNEKCDEPTLG